MTRVRLLVAIVLSLVCSIPAFAEKRCKPSDREMFLQAEQVHSGGSFVASVAIEKHESVSWEVSGGTIASQDANSVTIVAGAPGSLEITAYIDKGGHCDSITRSVPVVCFIEQRAVDISPSPAKAGTTVVATTSVFDAQGETVEWEVAGGTILQETGGSVEIQAGGPGELTVSARITKGECTETFTSTVPIVCFIEDRVVGINFNPAKTGQQVIAATSVFTAQGETVEWEVLGGTILEYTNGFLKIQVGGAPGELTVNAHITKGECTKTFSRTVPIICYIGDRPLSVGENPVPSNRPFWAGIGLWDASETVEWTVRGNGSIEFIDNSAPGASFASILAGAPGTIEIEATINRAGSCTRTFTQTVTVECRPDPTIGLFFDKGSARVGETVKAWTNIRAGQTAHWEITNGTPATADGASVDIVAGGTEGHLIIDLYVGWGTSCVEHRRAYIFMYR